MPDPYQTLGVKRDASADEIKRAYRKLAKSYHPDHNRNDAKAAARFAEVNNAYEILGDEAKRRQFDRGEIDADGKPRAFSDMGGGGFPGGGAGGFRFDFGGGPGGNPRDIFSDLFRQFEGGPKDPFGGQAKGTGRRGPPPGEDITVETQVPLERVASGGAHRVAMPDGRMLEINVPKGVAHGATMRLRGQGHPSPFGAANGDALVTLRYAKHPVFVADGTDLRVSVAVPIRDAVLGGSVRVPTLTGEVEVTIPAWTSGGKTLRLRGKGLPRAEQAGDLFVTLEIDLGPHDPEVEGFFRRRPG
jgi:DnaJ-class molecular chaperone